MTNLERAARDAVCVRLNRVADIIAGTDSSLTGCAAEIRSVVAALESALKEQQSIIYEDELPEALPMSDELWAESYVDIVRVYPRQAVLEACYRHVCNQSEHTAP